MTKIHKSGSTSNLAEIGTSVSAKAPKKPEVSPQLSRRQSFPQINKEVRQRQDQLPQARNAGRLVDRLAGLTTPLLRTESEELKSHARRLMDLWDLSDAETDAALESMKTCLRAKPSLGAAEVIHDCVTGAIEDNPERPDTDKPSKAEYWVGASLSATVTTNITVAGQITDLTRVVTDLMRLWDITEEEASAALDLLKSQVEPLSQSSLYRCIVQAARESRTRAEGDKPELLQRTESERQPVYLTQPLRRSVWDAKTREKAHER